MILSSTYSRVAVRPFPVTQEMKVFVHDAVENLKSIAAFYREYDKLPVIKRSLLTGIGVLLVKVILEGGMKDYPDNYFGAGADLSQVYHDNIVSIYLQIKILGRGPDDIDFWSKVETTLLHELIHAVDPKNISAMVNTKIPGYYHAQTDAFGNISDEEYFKYISHPNEVSAFEGSNYYYFLASAKKGMPLKEAVTKFLKGLEIGDPGADYLRHMKKNKVRWRKYIERIYKSAEQAYSDFQKEG